MVVVVLVVVVVVLVVVVVVLVVVVVVLMSVAWLVGVGVDSWSLPQELRIARKRI